MVRDERIRKIQSLIYISSALLFLLCFIALPAVRNFLLAPRSFGEAAITGVSVLAVAAFLNKYGGRILR